MLYKIGLTLLGYGPVPSHPAEPQPTPTSTSVEQEDLLTALALRDNLGVVLTKQGKYSEAVTLLEQTFAKRESLNQSITSPGMLCTLNNLAAALLHQGHLASAESIHRRVLETNTQTLGISHPNTITTMHNLTAVLADQGSDNDNDSGNAKLSEAAELLQRALQSSQQVLGPSSPPSLGIMEEQVDIMLRQGKYEQAEGMTRTVLTLRRGMLRVQHLEIAKSMHSLGLELRKLGKGDESETLRREERAFRDSVKGGSDGGVKRWRWTGCDESRQISGPIISTCYEYRRGLKGVANDVMRLADEVKSLRDLLENLIKFVDDHPSQFRSVELLGCRNGALSRCLKEMQILQDKLQPSTGWKAVGRALKWPLSEPELLKVLTRLDRVKTTITIAMSTDQLKMSTGMQKDTRATHDDTQELVAGLKTLQRGKEGKQIFQWLEASDPSTNLVAARSKRNAATGLWLLQDKRLLRCSRVIDRLLDLQGCQSKFGVAYFFIDSNNASKRRPDEIVRTLIAQLSGEHLSAFDILKEHYVKATQRSYFGSFQRECPTVDSLMEVLKRILESFDQVYIVFDALDECTQLEEIVQFVDKLASWKIAPLRLLVTSRQHKIIEEAMEELEATQVTLDSAAVGPDIELHVEEVVAKDPYLRSSPDELKLEIQSNLIKGANGMFRWVECQFETLGKCWNPLAVRKVLRSLPKSLDDTYENIIASIDEQHIEDAVSILKCMLSSFRPLQLPELAEILAIDWDDNGHFDPSYRMPDIQAVRSICSGLLTSASSTKGTAAEVEVQLAHSSVRDFLISKRRKTVQSAFVFDEGDTHTFFAQCCLAYLLSITNKSKIVSKLKEEYPLAEYAAVHWIDHYRLARDKVCLSDSSITLFRKDRRDHFIKWCQLYNLDKPWLSYSLHNSPGEFPSALYYASLAGLDMIVEGLLDSGEPPNQRGGVFGFPLQAAAYEGHISVARRLLEAGAHLDLRGGKTSYPIMAAASRGHADIIRLLLDHGALYDATDFGGGTPLLQAADNGHAEVARILLEAGADPNLIVGKRGSALTAAAANGHESVCRLLLKHGAELSENENLCHHDIQAAAVCGHENIVNLLLGHGAKPTASLLSSASKARLPELAGKLLEQGAPASGGRYVRPLPEAAEGGSLPIVCQLLAHGVDVNAHDQHRQTALQAAAAAGQECVTKMLLERGAIIDIGGEFWGPALHAAAYHGHLPIVQMLLDHEPPADVNHPGAQRFNGRYFGSVLHNAAFSGNMATVKLVLQRGGRINEHRGPYGSPLQAAAVSKNTAIVEYLLENGADVNASGGEHGTALGAAASQGIVKMVEMLLRHGADINQRGSTGVPGGEECWVEVRPTDGPLRAAAKAGHATVVSQLLLAGADPELTNAIGPSGVSEDISPFEGAVTGGHSDTVQVFLQHGLDPNAIFPETKSRTRRYYPLGEAQTDEVFPIRQAGKYGHIDVMKSLVKAGGDVNMASSDGWTALHEATRAGHYPMMLVLLDDFHADMNMKLVNGSQAIHLAAQQGHDTCTRILLDRGMDINVRNVDGSTPLHTAADNGRRDVVKTLISKGADSGVVDEKAGLTALELAEFKLAREEIGQRAEPRDEHAVKFGRMLYGWKETIDAIPQREQKTTVSIEELPSSSNIPT